MKPSTAPLTEGPDDTSPDLAPPRPEFAPGEQDGSSPVRPLSLERGEHTPTSQDLLGSEFAPGRTNHMSAIRG